MSRPEPSSRPASRLVQLPKNKSAWEYLCDECGEWERHYFFIRHEADPRNNGNFCSNRCCWDRKTRMRKENDMQTLRI